ncbi:MAG: MoaD/ThiS family protein [Aeropyrum sp.]|nr:MoaD/ThiS family protein [Aeropyrum sp.]MCE4616394.1 MoaD/ThiS family protein [Aeropyrum sp.]
MEGRARVRLVPEGRELDVEVGGGVTARRLLEELGMNEEMAVVLRDGAPLLPEDRVRPGDRVEVVRVLSGG